MAGKKAISIAIFGFITIGLAIGGLVWVQYNANQGIREKISSGEGFGFMRLNDESMKIDSYLDSSFRAAGMHALRYAAASGVSRTNETRYWQCGEPQTPGDDELVYSVSERAREMLNAYRRLVTDDESHVIVYAEPVKCVNAEFIDEDGTVILRGSGGGLRMTDGRAFVGSDGSYTEASAGNSGFFRDYSILKRWVENDVSRKYVEMKLNDEQIMPQGLNYESCSCTGGPVMSAESVVSTRYPCWEASIRNAVSAGIDEAVDALENDEMYFAGKSVSCYPVIRCVSARMPALENEARRSYASGRCCGSSCSGCERDACAISSTPKVCDGVSAESVCPRPDCEPDAFEDELCTVSYEKELMHMSDAYVPVSGSGCEMCSAVSFGLIYYTDVDFTVVCQDMGTIVTSERGIEPMTWEVNIFFDAKSSAGSGYRGTGNAGC